MSVFRPTLEHVRLTVVGCSGSFPGPESAASSYLVQADHEGRTWSILLDLGSGALGPLQRYLDPTLELDAIFLSHLHVDHCADLCGLYVMQKYNPAGSRGSLPVYGPTRSPDFLALVYGDVEEQGMGREFDFRLIVDGGTYQVGPFAVHTRRVNHPVEAFGFRVEADGEVLTYTGDTDACEAVVDLMRDADLVLADSAFVAGRDHIEGIHMNGRSAAESAVAAGGVRRLMLTHMPPWNDREVCRAQAREVWSGELALAEPGATYALNA